MLNYVLIIGMLLVAFSPMICEIRKRKFDFFNAKNPFIIYYIIQLAISGAVTFYTGIESEVGLEPIAFSTYYTRALLISLLGLALFQFGYYSQNRSINRMPRLMNAEWVEGRQKLVVCSFFILGMLSAILLIKINGGLETFLSEREQWRTSGMVGQGILLFPATNMISFAALLYFLSAARKSNVSIAKTILAYVFALLPAYIFGFRSAIILPVLQLMVAWNYVHKRINGMVFGLSCIIIVVSFTLYGIARNVPVDVKLDTSQIIEAIANNPELVYAVVSRSKGTEVVASVIHKLDNTGNYDLGWRSLFEAATIFIPKSIWAGKPQPSSVRFTTYFFGDSLAYSRGIDREEWGGISPTIVGELYWHFGAAGVLLGLYLFGRTVKIIYSTFMNERNNPSIQLIYPIVYTNLAMFAEAVQGYTNLLVMYSVMITFVLIILTTPVYPCEQRNN